MTFFYTLIEREGEKKVFSLKCITKSNVIKKNWGFSIKFYVFGNGLIIKYLHKKSKLSKMTKLHRCYFVLFVNSNRWSIKFSSIFLITIDFCIHFKEKTFFFSFCFLVAPIKVHKKVVKFSFKRQKTFWVLVFCYNLTENCLPLSL